MRSTLAGILVFALASLGYSDSKQDPEGKPSLSQEEQKILDRQKFVIGKEEYRQVFTPYLWGDLPPFITSDSVLNAFHVLFEESIYQMERNYSHSLPVILKYTSEHLDEASRGLEGEPKVLEQAKHRAKIFLGVALRLVDETAGKFDEPTNQLIRQEIARIHAAKDRSKPAWLGPPDEGFLAIDYSRFNPRGFYTKNEKLKRYFHAVSWMQAIPFRVEKDDELFAAVILARAADPADNTHQAKDATAAKKTLAGFDRFLGKGDDFSIATLDSYHRYLVKGAPSQAQGKSNLAWIREQLIATAKEKGTPRINDQLALPPKDPKSANTVSFRMIAAYRLPDAGLLQQTAHFNRRGLSGLDVAAALGSPFARKITQQHEPKGLLPKLDAYRTELVGVTFDDPDERFPSRHTHYQRYLRCLATLMESNEPDWPAFMKSEAWQAKTCQTALGGWAQLRHTWALQSKLNVRYVCSSEKTHGFVEPIPEFYRELGLLCEYLTSDFRQAGIFSNRSSDETTAEMSFFIEQAVEVIEKTEAKKRGNERLHQLTPSERSALEICAQAFGQGKLADLKTPDQFGEFEAKLLKMLARLEDQNVALEWRWDALRQLCTTLELLSHKQLRGRDFSVREKEFMQGFGIQLAKLMFYEGNSYVTPRDDAPRIVDVFSSQEGYLEVGVGKPRTIFVLYPWKGKEILCRGAIMPYYEFTHRERLTDQAWLGILNQKKAPAQPPWVKGLQAE